MGNPAGARLHRSEQGARLNREPVLTGRVPAKPARPTDFYWQRKTVRFYDAIVSFYFIEP